MTLQQILPCAVGNDDFVFPAEPDELGVKGIENILVRLVKIGEDRLTFLGDEGVQVTAVSGDRTAVVQEMAEADALQGGLDSRYGTSSKAANAVSRRSGVSAWM